MDAIYTPCEKPLAEKRLRTKYCLCYIGHFAKVMIKLM